MKKRHLTTMIMLACLMPVFAQDGPQWKLVWSDEFNGDGPYDATVWEPERGFVRNHEAQWYQGENAFRQNGCLVIEGRKVATTTPNPTFRKEGATGEGGQGRRRNDWRTSRETIDYTSSSLTTRRSFSFLYGRLEVRAKIPTAGGSWPAIWLLGKGLPWPSCGEVDVMEYYRIKGVPHILANVAWGNDRPFEAVWNSKRVPFTHFTSRDEAWARRFHVWRMDWDETSIRLYLDDELLNEVPMSQTVNGKIGRNINPFTRKQYILLNLALGGDNGGEIDDAAFPMRYEIDYVRIYERCQE